MGWVGGGIAPGGGVRRLAAEIAFGAVEGGVLAGVMPIDGLVRDGVELGEAHLVLLVVVEGAEGVVVGIEDVVGGEGDGVHWLVSDRVDVQPLWRK